MIPEIIFPVCLLTSLLCCFLSFTNLKVTNPISTWCNPIGLMKLRLSEKIVHHLFFLVFYWKKIRNTGNCAPCHCEEKFSNEIIRCMNNSFRNFEFCSLEFSVLVVIQYSEDLARGVLVFGFMEFSFTFLSQFSNVFCKISPIVVYCDPFLLLPPTNMKQPSRAQITLNIGWDELVKGNFVGF